MEWNKAVETVESVGKPDCDLVGSDSNAFAIMGKVTSTLRHGLRGKLSPEVVSDVIDAYRKQAMSGDYNNLLSASMQIVEA